MLKVTTEHGTYYLIDFEKNRALRMKGPYSNEIIRDGIWFAFSNVFAYDKDSKNFEDGIRGSIEIGYAMYFALRNYERVSWIRTSNVISIEEVEDE